MEWRGRVMTTAERKEGERGGGRIRESPKDRREEKPATPKT